MKRTILLTTLLALTVVPARLAYSHCEVPCGIYGDQMRFEQMLENTTTIAKAIAQVNELASKADAQSINQRVRWITTKEEHATRTQHIIAQYFMTQRIKSDKDGYAKKLSSAHAVMVSAMKCKQQANPAAAEALRKAILDFYRAYEGKEPRFETHD